MYSRLKERPLRMLERELGANARGKKKRLLMFVAGCRSKESVRRIKNTDELSLQGRTVWVNPIHDWDKCETGACLEVFKKSRNPVVDLIHKSGECLCGAFAKPGELDELNMWDLTRPAYLEIKRIEALVKPIWGTGWGVGAPKQKPCRLQPGPLCWDCQKTAPETSSQFRQGDVKQAAAEPEEAK
jgi:hypothetical protein